MLPNTPTRKVSLRVNLKVKSNWQLKQLISKVILLYVDNANSN